MRRFNELKSVWAAMALSAAFLVPSAGWAQDETADELIGGDSAAAADEAPAEAAAAPAEAAPPTKGPFPRISDSEETIFAVQRKAFLVEGKFELTPLFSTSFADRFVQTFAPAGSVVYHLSENFGLELYGSYMLPTESGLTKEILNDLQLRSDISKLTQMLWTAGLGVQFSPIYGKLQILGTYIGNFSFYVGAGFGVGETRVQCTNGLPLDPNRGFPTNANGEVVCNPNDLQSPGAVNPVYYEPNTFRVMGALSGGVRFHFLTWLAVKLEVKDYLFVARVYRPDDAPSLADSVRNNIFLQLGVSFLLGGDED